MTSTWRVSSANGIRGVAGNEPGQTNNMTNKYVTYLGRHDSAEACWAACNATHACKQWTWHSRGFVSAKWARTCFLVRRWPPVLTPDDAVTTGVLQPAPVWRQSGFGWHTAWYSHVLGAKHRASRIEARRTGATPTLFVPRVEQTLGWEEPYRLTAALPPETDDPSAALHGAAAEAALAAHAAPPSHGLLLMVSSRQAAREFAASAGALALSRPPLPLSAMLLICNNATAPVEATLRWLARYRQPRMLRMLVRTARNLGYYCGQFVALAASARLWARFAWVLHPSGPDCVLLPQAAAMLHARIPEEGRRGAAYLGDRFPAPRGHRRYSMDLFVFWPARLLLPNDGSERGLVHSQEGPNSIWRSTARWCLHGFGPDDGPPHTDEDPIPEILLTEMQLRNNLSFRLLSEEWHRDMHAGRSKQAKLAAHAPRFGYLWHSHNISAVERWLETQVAIR